MRDDRKWAYILPNIFTVLNLFCGFVAIVLTITGSFYQACLVLGLGGLFDSVDGRIARMVGCESSFGEQFDSMSDLVSFGIAPSILMYNKYFYFYGRLGMFLAFLIVLCATLRLSRFNINIGKIHKDYFQGLPVPMAAFGFIGFILFDLEFHYPIEVIRYASIPYVIIYSALMISNIPFPSFKKSEWVKSHQKYVFMLIISILASLFIYGEIVIVIITTIYIFGSLGYFLTHRGRYQDIFNWKEEADGE